MLSCKIFSNYIGKDELLQYCHLYILIKFHLSIGVFFFQFSSRISYNDMSFKKTTYKCILDKKMTFACASCFKRFSVTTLVHCNFKKKIKNRFNEAEENATRRRRPRVFIVTWTHCTQVFFIKREIDYN